MTDIIVQRGGGTHRGDDIIDPLLCTEAAAIERGRVEIDAATQSSIERIEHEYTAGAMPGDLIVFADAWRGKPWRGKVTGVRHRIELTSDAPVLMTELTVEKPD